MAELFNFAPLTSSWIGDGSSYIDIYLTRYINHPTTFWITGTGPLAGTFGPDFTTAVYDTVTHNWVSRHADDTAGAIMIYDVPASANYGLQLGLWLNPLDFDLLDTPFTVLLCLRSRQETDTDLAFAGAKFVFSSSGVTAYFQESDGNGLSSSASLGTVPLSPGTQYIALRADINVLDVDVFVNSSQVGTTYTASGTNLAAPSTGAEMRFLIDFGQKAGMPPFDNSQYPFYVAPPSFSSFWTKFIRSREA